MADTLNKVFASNPIDSAAQRVIQKGVERISAPEQNKGRKIYSECPQLFHFSGPKTNDLKGKRFGHFTVVGYAGNVVQAGTTSALWAAKCDCGLYEIKKTSTLKKSLTTNKTLIYACRECEYADLLRKRSQKRAVAINNAVSGFERLRNILYAEAPELSEATIKRILYAWFQDTEALKAYEQKPDLNEGI